MREKVEPGDQPLGTCSYNQTAPHPQNVCWTPEKWRPVSAPVPSPTMNAVETIDAIAAAKRRGKTLSEFMGGAAPVPEPAPDDPVRHNHERPEDRYNGCPACEVRAGVPIGTTKKVCTMHQIRYEKNCPACQLETFLNSPDEAVPEPARMPTLCDQADPCEQGHVCKNHRTEASPEARKDELGTYPQSGTDVERKPEGVIEKACPLCGHSPIYKEAPQSGAPHGYYCHGCNRGFEVETAPATAVYMSCNEDYEHIHMCHPERWKAEPEAPEKRAEFERWAKTQDFSIRWIATFSQERNEYYNSTWQVAWAAWQARARLSVLSGSQAALASTPGAGWQVVLDLEAVANGWWAATKSDVEMYNCVSAQAQKLRKYLIAIGRDALHKEPAAEIAQLKLELERVGAGYQFIIQEKEDALRQCRIYESALARLREQIDGARAILTPKGPEGA